MKGQFVSVTEDGTRQLSAATGNILVIFVEKMRMQKFNPGVTTRMYMRQIYNLDHDPIGVWPIISKEDKTNNVKAA